MFPMYLSKQHPPRRIISSVLGSMSTDTSCTSSFSWHYPGSNEYRSLINISDDESKKIESFILLGKKNIDKDNGVANSIKSGDQSVQKHDFLNYRQYVGRRLKS